MNNHKISISSIDWDTDGQEVDLPTSLDIPLDPSDMEQYESVSEDIYSFIENYLSDTYGFCVNSYEID